MTSINNDLQIAQPQLKRDFFKTKGFVEYPHFTIGNGLFLDIGRNRIITISSAGTPNEMMFISQISDTNDKEIEDIVCIHNYDYDGFITECKLNNILSFFLK